MVTIIDAKPAHGYSQWDHLLTGREADGVIGLSFRTVKAACEAADRAVKREGDHRAVDSGPHVHVTIKMADGSVIHRTTQPHIVASWGYTRPMGALRVLQRKYTTRRRLTMKDQVTTSGIIPALSASMIHDQDDEFPDMGESIVAKFVELAEEAGIQVVDVLPRTSEVFVNVGTTAEQWKILERLAAEARETVAATY